MTSVIDRESVEELVKARTRLSSLFGLYESSGTLVELEAYEYVERVRSYDTVARNLCLRLL